MVEITPLYKKGDIYDKGNYRPANVLPCVSNLFECVLIDHSVILIHYFPSICQDLERHTVVKVFLRTLLKHVRQNWIANVSLVQFKQTYPRHSLASRMVYLSASYGVHHDSCQLLISYVSNRRQRVKVWDTISDLAMITKGTA